MARPPPSCAPRRLSARAAWPRLDRSLSRHSQRRRIAPILAAMKYALRQVPRAPKTVPPALPRYR
jgi:hypothetical protein